MLDSLLHFLPLLATASELAAAGVLRPSENLVMELPVVDAPGYFAGNVGQSGAAYWIWIIPV